MAKTDGDTGSVALNLRVTPDVRDPLDALAGRLPFTRHRIAGLALVVALAACSPSQFDERRWGRVGVWIDPASWASSYRDEFAVAMRDLAAIGPTFIRSAGPENADVIVEHWDSGGCRAAGEWHVARHRFVRIDPVCAQGSLVLRTLFAHGVLHAIGLSHVCRHPGETSDCSPVGYGAAIMNPSLTYGDDSGPTLHGAHTGPIPTWLPSDLDLAELRRVRRP